MFVATAYRFLSAPAKRKCCRHYDDRGHTGSSSLTYSLPGRNQASVPGRPARSFLRFGGTGFLLPEIERIDHSRVNFSELFGMPKVILVCLLNNRVGLAVFLKQRLFERLEQLHRRVGR